MRTGAEEEPAMEIDITVYAVIRTEAQLVSGPKEKQSPGTEVSLNVSTEATQILNIDLERADGAEYSERSPGASCPDRPAESPWTPERRSRRK
ncbi:UNVERIFIED_CONTAM: hypothetical protein K2H54_033833 [Gekko kuhli]